MTGYHNASDGKFATAKVLVPQCLDMCDTLTITDSFIRPGVTWMHIGA